MRDSSRWLRSKNYHLVKYWKFPLVSLSLNRKVLVENQFLSKEIPYTSICVFRDHRKMVENIHQNQGCRSLQVGP